MLPALRSRAFRTLALLYTANAVLEWFGSVALMVLVYDATDSPLVAAAMLICKQVLPAFVVGPFGRLIDRVEVRRVVASTFSLQAGALLLLALSGYGPWIFPLAFVAGVGSAFGRAALRAAVARTLDGADLRAGNAVLNLVLGVAVPLGPAVGATVVAATSPTIAFLVAATGMGLLAVCSVWLATGSSSVEEEAAEASEDTSPLAPRIRPAVPVSWLLLLGGFTTGVSTIAEPSLLAYSRDFLGSGVAGYGALHMAWALGVTVGSAVFARLLAWPMLRVYAVATALSAVGYLAVGLSPSIEFAFAFALIGGIGTGMDWVAIVTAVQEATSRDRQGQVAARLEAYALAGPAVGILLGGLLAEAASARWALLAPGFLCIAVLVVGYLATRFRSGSSGHRALPLSPSLPGGSI